MTTADLADRPIEELAMRPEFQVEVKTRMRIYVLGVVGTTLILVARSGALARLVDGRYGKELSPHGAADSLVATATSILTRSKTTTFEI